MDGHTLDHVNIQTEDMAGTIAFYESLLGLEARERPPVPAAHRMWLYDSGGRAVIHLNLNGTDTNVARDIAVGGNTGAIHHIAFACSDYDAMLNQIEAMGLTPVVRQSTNSNLRQIFVTDPNNVMLELNFRP